MLNTLNSLELHSDGESSPSDESKPSSNSYMNQWFDYALTFSEEVELIWRRKWSLASVLYLATRYLTFIDGLVVILGGSLWLTWRNAYLL
jgi:hypothetical protein